MATNNPQEGRRTQSDPIDGFYVTEGTCSGSRYRGTTVIRSLGNDAYCIHWNIDGAVHTGTAIRMGDAVAVTVPIPGLSVVLYKIHPSTGETPTMLRGKYRFCAAAGGQVEEEVLTFSQELKSWEVGDRILGNWTHDPLWYPGTVMEKAGEDDDLYRVQFADGDEEWLTSSRIMDDLLTVGDKVRYGGGSYRIIHREGDALHLQSPMEGPFLATIDSICTIAPRERHILLED